VGVLHVSCAAEGGYVEHSAAMLHSVLVHAGGLTVHVHYLHGPRLEARDRELLAGMVEGEGGEISFHRIEDEQVAGLPEAHRFTGAMWYRLFLPELLHEVDRILYLDVDTLAVDSLEPLWETDITGQYLGAVTNVFEPWYLDRPRELGLAGPEVYFNSGVLLFNLERMRSDDCGETLRRLASERGHELLWPDQDALNLVLGGRRVPLHPRWNCMNSVMTFEAAAEVFDADTVEEARRRPGIRHFEGPGDNKPWHYLSDYPLRERYFEHRRATPWPRTRLEERTPRNVLRRLRRRVSA
jgi:lipopolysaccharide biosynthesis glycosyltransferase